MIIKSKAVEPKAGSATSVYPAVIVNISIPSVTSYFVYLQIFCPSVMSGDLMDAKSALNNWIEAPKIPHNGADAYSFKVGGIVMISYQNGNIDSPQFVRYVEVSDRVIEENAKYIGGVPITNDSTIISILDNRVTLETDILQKVLVLLPALEACAKNGDDYLYLHTKEGDIDFMLYKCGKYGTELISKNKTGRYNPNNFDYLTTSEYNNFLKICQYLFESEDDEGNNLVSIVNNTVKEFVEEVTGTPYGDDKLYDSLNLADKLYWWAQIAGYIYSDDTSIDTSIRIAPAIKEKIKSDKLKVTDLSNKGGMRSIFCYGDISMYQIVSRYDNSDYEDDKINQENRFKFIQKLWRNLSNNSYFSSKLASRYAIILQNNLFNLKTHYNVKSLTNKMLLICDVIASSYPALEPVILNFDLFDSVKDSGFVKYIKDTLEDDSKLLSSFNTYQIAEGFASMYFTALGYTEPKTTDFVKDQYPYDKVRNSMLNGIRYILSNYNSIKDIMSLNEEEIIIVAEG